MLIGVLGGVKAELNLALTMVKRQRIIGSVLRSRPLAEKTAIIEKFAETVLPLMADGTISPLISEVYPLEKAADAHRVMEAGGHFGKIVLAVGIRRERAAVPGANSRSTTMKMIALTSSATLGFPLKNCGNDGPAK